ncbi:MULTISPECIES: tyrosine-protein phosphatase [Acidithrix]|uniref:Tyrosine specific protein phosphatases domain-containing protein n=1 Tax=Acidithrix ferrooxidans TaxID=1280514 RepID=A0A0D8HD54_9ACTN|nr:MULTISPECIES: tyrosine-protein phosphatase [Acidithrix]KJF15875.1 hypothetical protein AXFE_32790 [Acidithrix ferrooxidans]
MVHCAAGKDRTGVLVALVLFLIGVPEEAAALDYLKTAENMDRVVQRFRTWPRYANNMENLPEEIDRCEPRTIETFLRVLNSRYGGAHEWVLQKGVSVDAIEQLGASHSVGFYLSDFLIVFLESESCLFCSYDRWQYT